MKKKMTLAALIFFTLVFPGGKACLAEEPLMAIDVLLEPDDAMVAVARADNTRLLENYPQGFALDATHVAHISVLQCYVRIEDLGKVFDAVKRVSDAQNPVGMELETTGYFAAPWQGLGLAGINIAPPKQLLSYQEAIVAAVEPFIAKNGTVAAFFPNEDGTPGDATIAAYVNSFVSRHIGKNYSPHITIGLGKEDFIREMVAAPYAARVFKIQGVGVYQLGDYGTARKRLWTFDEMEQSGDPERGELLSQGDRT